MSSYIRTVVKRNTDRLYGLTNTNPATGERKNKLKRRVREKTKTGKRGEEKK